MKQLWEHVVPRNTGYAWEMTQGQIVKMAATSIIDFVCLNRTNLRERFDQARTKANQFKMFITTGDVLYSKSNGVMMTIVEDQFDGKHDLQYGACNPGRWKVALARGDFNNGTYARTIKPEEFPDHGCWENLSSALAPYQTAPEDVPSPFNIFQHMFIDSNTGKLAHSAVRPKPGQYILMRADMDLVCAISACPDMSVGPGDVTVTLLEQ